MTEWMYDISKEILSTTQWTDVKLEPACDLQLPYEALLAVPQELKLKPWNMADLMNDFAMEHGHFS